MLMIEFDLRLLKRKSQLYPDFPKECLSPLLFSVFSRLFPFPQSKPRVQDPQLPGVQGVPHFTWRFEVVIRVTYGPPD